VNHLFLYRGQEDNIFIVRFQSAYTCGCFTEKDASETSFKKELDLAIELFLQSNTTAQF
ncbi:hypothetical protein BgiMline_030143, partial [Biomphalaria glabrata]